MVCGRLLCEAEVMGTIHYGECTWRHVDRFKERIADYRDWSIHRIRQSRSERKRKMGHVTIMTENLEETRKEIEQSGIWQDNNYKTIISTLGGTDNDRT